MSDLAPPDQNSANHPDPIVEAVGRAVVFLLGPDRQTRARTAATLLCAVVYGICCGAAFYAADLGLMRSFAPTLLLITSVPAYAVFYLLIRTGKSRQFKDPSLMPAQNLLALLAIAFAYTAIAPEDRGVALVLVALVMVFGMYAHTASYAVTMGTMFLVILGIIMGVLAHVDPVFYPPPLELLRFELILGTVPSMIYASYQITTWRTRLTTQRRDLKLALAQVQKLATRDVLTGLYNRRFMQDRLEDCIGRFDRYGERFTIVLVDLDHFKRINDQYGHKVGDQALTAFASASGMVLRDTDTIARWGGEEFLLLLPNTSSHKAAIAMERLRIALVDCAISPDVPDLRLHFSSGIAVHDGPAALSQTLELADRALYQAKNNGRDRDVCANPDKH
jgi:diguanylate cyclase (GGDEF)-like protein